MTTVLKHVIFCKQVVRTIQRVALTNTQDKQLAAGCSHATQTSCKEQKWLNNLFTFAHQNWTTVSKGYTFSLPIC